VKIAIFADTHIHPYSRYSSIGESGQNSWVEETLDTMRRMYEKCCELNVHEVWFAGDLFHTGEKIQTEVFNAVVRFFDDVPLPTTLIAGNHDFANRHNKECILTALEPYVRVVIDRICETYYKAPDRTVAMVPYGISKEEIECCPSMKSILTGKPGPGNTTGKIPPLIVVGHLAMEGAVTGANEFQPPGGLSASIFAKTEQTFLGHYHKRQQLTPKVQYVGSLVSTSFNETGEQKGFTVLTLEEGKDLQIEFVSLKSTGFQVIDLDEKSKESDEVLDGNIVRVDYTGVIDESEVRMIMLSQGARRVIFNCKTPRETIMRVVTEGDREPELNDYLKTWVDTHGEGFDKERLLAVGKRLAKDVRNV